MEVGQGQNWGCSAKEKKRYVTTSWVNSLATIVSMYLQPKETNCYRSFILFLLLGRKKIAAVWKEDCDNGM
jgi:hypothetical protein